MTTTDTATGRTEAADAASSAHEYQGRTVTWRVHVLRVPEEGAKVSVSTQ